MFNEIMTWAAIIEVPLFAALFRMLTKNRQSSAEADDKTKEALADFKLHVARNYASLNYLKDVENRLTNHLLRIEKKLDDTGRIK